MNKPEALETLMYGLMKEARRNSFMDFLENWEITEEEYDEIKEWFKDELNIKL